MIQVRGVVFRIVQEPHCHVEYRTRDTSVLLSDAEWGWSARKDDAWVFDLFGPVGMGVAEADAQAISAECHVDWLKDHGEKHAHAMTFGAACATARKDRAETAARAAMHSVREVGLGSRISPEEAFAINERKGLA